MGKSRIVFKAKFGFVAALVSVSLVGCWFTQPPQGAPLESPRAVVAFPQGQASLEATAREVTPTDAMKAAVPDATLAHTPIDVTMTKGEFPQEGASLTYKLDAPVPVDKVGLIAYWNPEAEEWEPRETELSADRMSATARVDHFSEYNFFELAFNGINKAFDNATDPPTCPGGLPSWADPSFHKDDINAPYLWCVGTDIKNPDIMEVRVKGNRSVGASLSTALAPAWVWGDLFDSVQPVTWASAAASVGMDPTLWGEKYLLQPLGEYRFGFHRNDLVKHWKEKGTAPLIAADSKAFHAVAGLMYQAIDGVAEGKLAGAFIIASMLECGSDLTGAAGEQSLGDAFKGIAGCLNDRRDEVISTYAELYVKMRPGASNNELKVAGKLIGAVGRFVANGYTLIKATMSVGAFIGDLTLDPIVRQFIFNPSVDEIRRVLGNTKTYASSPLGSNLSFKYPATWSVTPQASGWEVRNARNEKIAAADVLAVWGYAGAVKPRPLFRETITPGTGTLSAASGKTPTDFAPGPTQVLTNIMDLTDYPEDRANTYGWERNVAVHVSLGGVLRESGPRTEAIPPLLYGIGRVRANDPGNGWPQAVVIFGAQRYFDNVTQAEAWTKSEEYRQIVEMIGSFKG